MECVSTEMAIRIADCPAGVMTERYRRVDGESRSDLPRSELRERSRVTDAGAHRAGREQSGALWADDEQKLKREIALGNPVSDLRLFWFLVWGDFGG
jgi:hypothetical protein